MLSWVLFESDTQTWKQVSRCLACDRRFTGLVTGHRENRLQSGLWACPIAVRVCVAPASNFMSAENTNMSLLGHIYLVQQTCFHLCLSLI